MQLMKRAACAAVLLFGALPAEAARLRETPVTQVVTLLGEIKARIEADGQTEQKTYDSYACWCESTLAKKAEDVSTAKTTIEALQTGILKLKGDLGAHTATIAQLKKDIAANIESQRETEELREKENAEYIEEKEEAEQCIGALEAAIKVLSGAGTGKGFLETLQEARLLSVVAGVRNVLGRSAASRGVSDKDLAVVKHFVDSPEDFVHSASAMSAAQIAQNPFGDYAPQSTQIQGILKSMYDSFTSDLEKNNAEEGSKQKAFVEIMATKKQELATLQTTLEAQERDEAAKSKQVADDKESLDDTKDQLAADEAFFAETKGTCQTKAAEWAERSRLRTEELHSIEKAVTILSSDEAKEIFKGATSFVQLSSVSVPLAEQPGRNTAYKQLKELAMKTKSLSLAKVAVSLKTGGHFDKIIVQIERMVEFLRAEEQDDIKHRDRCQSQVQDNLNTMEDINHDISKVDAQLTRLATEISQMGTEIDAMGESINTTKDNIAEVRSMRSAEIDEFRKSVQYDTDAVALLEKAIAALSKFYESNGMSLELAQKERGLAAAPSPAVANPPTIWDSPYGGRKQESTGIVAILSLIKEDLEKEVTLAREADAAASKSYVAEVNALQKTLETQTASKIAMDKQLAAMLRKQADLDEVKNQKGEDLAGEQTRQGVLNTDCMWVRTHFESRRTKRKAEIDGLIEAKNFLNGMESEI